MFLLASINQVAVACDPKTLAQDKQKFQDQCLRQDQALDAATKDLDKLTKKVKKQIQASSDSNLPVQPSLFLGPVTDKFTESKSRRPFVFCDSKSFFGGMVTGVLVGAAVVSVITYSKK